MKFKQQAVSLAILAAVGSAAFAQSGETVKIALIDPQSGLMGPLGLNQLRSFQFFADTFTKANAAGVKYEVVGFDNKLSPAESLNTRLPTGEKLGVAISPQLEEAFKAYQGATDARLKTLEPTVPDATPMAATPTAAIPLAAKPVALVPAAVTEAPKPAAAKPKA